MARGNRVFSGGFGSGRGENRDFDARPGASYESPTYAQHYDVRSETEYTNLPETLTQIRGHLLDDQQKQEARASREAMIEAEKRVQFFPSVGKFVIPRENSWASHAALIKDPKHELGFNIDKYVYFDRVVAVKAGIRGLWDPLDSNYDKYEQLRTNLAVLRNDTIGIYLHDGAFNPGDEKYIPLITGIASELGTALSNDKWWKRPFTNSLPVAVANVEGTGAQEMYSYLLRRQTAPGSAGSLLAVAGAENRNWGLPQLENTPYSTAGLSTPLPAPKVCLTPAELAKGGFSEKYLREQLQVPLKGV